MVKVRFTTLVSSDPKLNYNKHTEELGEITAGVILVKEGISISVHREDADAFRKLFQDKYAASHTLRDGGQT